MNIKKELLKQCQIYVSNRLKTVQKIIADNQNGLQSETKSSAGDKHETGRAMVQLEMEKAGQQLAGINEMQEILAKIELANIEFAVVKNAHLGTVVFTDTNTYFLAISVGKLSVLNQHYFAISTASPIGRLLLGKKKGDSISFNENLINIEKIY